MFSLNPKNSISTKQCINTAYSRSYTIIKIKCAYMEKNCVFGFLDTVRQVEQNHYHYSYKG